MNFDLLRILEPPLRPTRQIQPKPEVEPTVMRLNGRD